MPNAIIGHWQLDDAYGNFDTLSWPLVKCPEGQFDDDDKMVLELSADFLGPVYMNMGTLGGWGNPPNPVEKIARVYI